MLSGIFNPSKIFSLIRLSLSMSNIPLNESKTLFNSPTVFSRCLYPDAISITYDF